MCIYNNHSNLNLTWSSIFQFLLYKIHYKNTAPPKVIMHSFCPKRFLDCLNPLDTITWIAQHSYNTH